MFGEHCLSCTAGYGSSCQGSLIDDAKERVKSYYGKILKSTKDLKTNACCSADSMPPSQRNILNKVHPEIRDKFYGCGSPIPPILENCTILDLGCGTGRDAYIASALVGAGGSVIGVDMTDEQLNVAKKHFDYQMKEFGYFKPNVEFKQGYIEDLKEIGIRDNSID
ncbi:MAG: methyltransferase domain-containing protein, partial [Candidatus Omnitrophica bacterium]|nr:methyltransferase domain-containing protein [Candidatus Omnitrophota bacterium]